MDINIENRNSPGTVRDDSDWSGATGPCGRCEAQLPVEMHRCPECGYEPSSTRAATVIAAGALAVLAASLALLASIPLGTVPPGGWSVPAATARVLGIPGVLVSLPLVVSYRFQHRRTPTDDTIF